MSTTLRIFFSNSYKTAVVLSNAFFPYISRVLDYPLKKTKRSPPSIQEKIFLVIDRYSNQNVASFGIDQIECIPFPQKTTQTLRINLFKCFLL
jgi:hypothetical protein